MQIGNSKYELSERKKKVRENFKTVYLCSVSTLYNFYPVQVKPVAIHSTNGYAVLDACESEQSTELPYK